MCFLSLTLLSMTEWFRFTLHKMSWGFSIQKQNYQFAFNKLEKKDRNNTCTYVNSIEYNGADAFNNQIRNQ